MNTVDTYLLNLQKGGVIAQQAMDGLYRLMNSRLKQFFLKHRVDPNAVEELAQEVWVKVWKSCESFRGETKGEVWIWVIARNVMNDFFRAKDPEQGLDEEEWQAIFETTPAPKAEAWQENCFERQLQAFGEQHPERARILMFLLEGWEYEEIASYLKTTYQAARQRLYEARQKIAAYLEECQEMAS